MNSYLETSIIPIFQTETFKMRQYIKPLDASEGTVIHICHPLETKGAPELAGCKLCQWCPAPLFYYYIEYILHNQYFFLRVAAKS